MDHILGAFDPEYLLTLKGQVTSEEFTKIVTALANHSIKAQAELSYDLNAAVNLILSKFPGKDTLTVSEVHQTLRDLGIVDYAVEDMSYIEATLKRFGVLVQPDTI